MKKFSNLITLLPCHRLEDFPDQCTRDQATALLAAWTVTWHPELISVSETSPVWLPAFDTVSSEAEAEQHRHKYIQHHYYEDDGPGIDQNESDFDAEAFEAKWCDSLVIIPEISGSLVFDGFRNAATAIGATVISDVPSRAQALDLIGVESEIDTDLIADFFALAWTRLQVELMTQKLRYSSDLDSERFGKTAITAAKFAKQGDATSAREHIQTAFDQLTEEKNQYYPVAADLIDMVLVADSIRPQSIEAELRSDAPKCLVVTGSALEVLGMNSPATTEAIQQCVASGSLGLIAGPRYELPDNLLSVETILNQALKGKSNCESELCVVPEVFMRRRFGLNALLPGVLESLGYIGVIHATFDRGKIPKSFSPSMRWTGVDGSSIMAVGESPIDAASDKSFLDLGVRIGKELDSAHISNVFLARWPTQTCDGFEDLKNSTKYGSVLGEFSLVESYFENVYDPGYGDAYEADEYEGPWLEQAIASGSDRPLSTLVTYWQQWYQLSAINSLITMLSAEDPKYCVGLGVKLHSLQDRIEKQTQNWTNDPDSSIGDELEQLTKGLLNRFNCCVINPVAWKHSAHLLTQTAEERSGAFHGGKSIKHAAANSNRCDAIVELSGFGKLFSNPLERIDSESSRTEPLVDDGDSSLRNEFFEVRMDRDSGGIRGVHFYGQRGNLLSQRLAVRYVDQNGTVCYSQQICQSFEVVTLSPIASEIRTIGKLIDENGATLAKFEQTTWVKRGHNVIDLEIELSEVQELDGTDRNYIANRIAWSEETAELFCDIQGAKHPVRKPKIEAPHFVEVVQHENRFAILTKGLPWHRRASRKKLDSLLLVGNESQRSFRLAIAVNPESAMQTAVAEMHPQLIGSGEPVVTDESDWQLHVANRNLIVTWSSPVFDDDCRCTGMRVRLQEIDGQSGNLNLYCRRSVSSAVIESFQNQHVRDIAVGEEDGKAEEFSLVEMSFAAHQFFQLHLHWSEVQ